MAMSYDDKLQLVRMGLAVPGMTEEGKQAATEIDTRLRETGVYELGAIKKAPPSAPKKCTREDPCDIDGGLLRSLALTPGPVILLAAFALSVGNQAFASEEMTETDWEERLQRQAERSRKRRLDRQRLFAQQLEPIQAILGLNLVSAEDGLPTSDAYVFLAVAVGVQIAIASAVVAPLQEALS